MNTTKFFKKQLEIGAKVELEHTKSKKVARKTALDHLREYGPRYYIEHKKMISRLKKDRR